MARTASAVIRLLECMSCHGFKALGTCTCINKNEAKTNERNNPFAAVVLAPAFGSPTRGPLTAASNNNIEGVM